MVEALLEVHPLVDDASCTLALFFEVHLALEAEAQTAHLKQTRCLLFFALIAGAPFDHPPQHHYPHIHDLVLR